MLKAATLSATWKVVVEPFRPILHMLDETLHQVAPDRIVDVMLQTPENTNTQRTTSQAEEFPHVRLG
jgi:hypothetical protein